MKKPVQRNKLRDFSFYLLIAFGVVGFAVVYAINSARTGGNGQLPLRWIGLVGQTALTFGYPVAELRPLWRRRGFWAALGVMLAAHAVIFIGVLRHVRQWPLIYFVPVSFVEYAAILTVIDRLAYKWESRRPADRGASQRGS